MIIDSAMVASALDLGVISTPENLSTFMTCRLTRKAKQAKMINAAKRSPDAVTKL